MTPGTTKVFTILNAGSTAVVAARPPGVGAALIVIHKPGVAAGFSPRSSQSKKKRALALGSSLHRAILIATVMLCAPAAHSQGCAQCRDNMQSTPPSVQRAYRHAIELLAISGVAVFTGGIVLLRRFR